MNEYTLQADFYERCMKQHPETNKETKENIQRKIKIFSMMAELNEKEKNEIFNSGAYNDVCRGYFRKAMENCKIDREIINAVLAEFKWLLDTVGAGEIR